MAAQFFRMKSFRSIRFPAFKWKEFQLYETELCFILPILGRSSENIASADEPFFHIKEGRDFSETELEEFKGIPLRNFYKMTSGVYPFNALNNKGLKRNAPEVMPLDSSQ